MSKKDGVLFLVQKEPWFSMVRDKIKLEEYRELNQFYASRFCKGGLITNDCEMQPAYFHQFNKVHFVNGMPKKGTSKEKHLVFDRPKIHIGTGKPEWGAKPGKLYFVITWEQNEKV